MTTTATDQTQTETPPPVEAVEEQQDTTTTTETPTAELDTETETLDIPDSSAEGGKVKYVPLSALAGARAELQKVKAALETAKAGSARAQQLEQQLTTLQGQVDQLLPIAQAYQAAVQQAPAQPQEMSADERAELEDLARTMDLWDAQGQPDIAKAQKAAAIFDKRAGRQAQATVAPIHQQTEQSRATYNLQRAMNTDINGVKADPDILKGLWARPEMRALAATDEGAKHLLVQAVGMTVVAGKGTPKAQARTAAGQFTATTEIPPPLHTEKAGGKDVAAVPLTESEKQVAKDLGLTDAEYIASANSAPWLQGRN